MTKRVFALLLALCTLFCLCLSISGCNDETASDDKKDKQNGGSVNQNSDEADPNSFFGFSLPENLEFGGTYTVLTTATEMGPRTHQIDPESNPMYSSENTTAVLTTALECTRLVEEKLGIEIEEEVVYTFSRYGGDMYQRITKDAMSSSGDYLFAMPCSIEASMLSIDGLLYDLNDVPNIDLSREWWCHSFNDTVAIDGKNYFAISDIGTVSKDATLFIAFNKKMADTYQLAQNYGYDSLYAMVDDNAWTHDRMYEMAKAVYQDNNNNNICDLGDINGIAGQDSAISNMFASAGGEIIALDKDGYPEITVHSERNIAIINAAQEYFRDPQSGFISANDYFHVSNVPVRDAIVPEFKADRLLFFMDAILNLDNIRDMESDFGVLPSPMYDNDQDGYVSRIGCWSANCIVVPNFVVGEDLELAGLIIEMLSAVSHKKLNPVYYEQTLQYQISRDDDSMRMLDIIFENRTCDLAELYHLEIYDTVCGMIDKPVGSFASAFESIEEKTQESLEEIIDAYKQNS